MTQACSVAAPCSISNAVPASRSSAGMPGRPSRLLHFEVLPWTPDPLDSLGQEGRRRVMGGAAVEDIVHAGGFHRFSVASDPLAAGSFRRIEPALSCNSRHSPRRCRAKPSLQSGWFRHRLNPASSALRTPEGGTYDPGSVRGSGTPPRYVASRSPRRRSCAPPSGRSGWVGPR